jgi:hypothetical protein
MQTSVFDQQNGQKLSLCQCMHVDERHNLAKEIRVYLEMVGYEQGLRVDQSLPTLEEYWRLRMATSAVKITTAALLLVYSITEDLLLSKHRSLIISSYTCKVQLPADVQDSKLLEDVYEAGNGVTSMLVIGLS